MDNNLPETVKENKNSAESVFLRTVIRKDVYDEFRDFAKEYSTGQGNWDFGVAIQILLQFFNESKLAVQSEKIDTILSLLSQREEVKEDVPEEKFTEFLGGTKEKI